MKIIATSDWHLGNLFHGNDRLNEHKHFLEWLRRQISEQQPDALLVAGDIFDNGNPSAASQAAYYEFLADANELCPQMQLVITAGNHDSANRLEAPRAVLTRHKVEVRGTIRHCWIKGENGEEGLQPDLDDLIIPIQATDGVNVAVLAVPYLRWDMVKGNSYSDGTNQFLRHLTARAREKYPDHRLVMMAHMYAKGADIAQKDASEKIVIGGQEEVNMEGWTDHPDYLTCGHIHKRQHIWNTTWARYTGSILPMSFAEKDYKHGVDLITIEGDHKPHVEFLEYQPQHQLCCLPEDDSGQTPKQLKSLIKEKLEDRKDGQLGDDFKYLVLKVKMDTVKNDDIKELEAVVATKNAVLCKIQKVIPTLELTTIAHGNKITSIDDILERDPLETLQEAYVIAHSTQMSDGQRSKLEQLLAGLDEMEN